MNSPYCDGAKERGEYLSPEELKAALNSHPPYKRKEPMTTSPRPVEETFPFISLRLGGIGTDDTYRSIHYSAVDGYYRSSSGTFVHAYGQWHRTSDSVEYIEETLHRCYTLEAEKKAAMWSPHGSWPEESPGPSPAGGSGSVQAITPTEDSSHDSSDTTIETGNRRTRPGKKEGR